MSNLYLGFKVGVTKSARQIQDDLYVEQLGSTPLYPTYASLFLRATTVIVYPEGFIVETQHLASLQNLPSLQNLASTENRTSRYGRKIFRPYLVCLN